MSDLKREFLSKRRGRNIALALALVAFVGLVYAVTLVRMGAGK